MKTFYVIRTGWNAANQSSVGSVRNPKSQFESNQYKLVGVCEAESASEAIEQCNCTVYSNQFVFAETNPRRVKGLTAEIRK